MKCRHCNAALSTEVLDLGASPPSNAYLGPADLHEPELWYPLRVMVCGSCFLVQTADSPPPEDLFTPGYAYLSSVSASWVAHAKEFADRSIDRFTLGPDSLVIEVAANDGYLLQHYVAAGIPCLGIEPAREVAQIARAKGVRIEGVFFAEDTAQALLARTGPADLMIANNVLAHVPDIRDFAAGFATLLKPEGTAVFEFPHVQRLLEDAQFDTVYHEHYSYLSLLTVERIFAEAGLTVYDADVLSTHGGSLRLYSRRSDGPSQPVGATLEEVRHGEWKAGLNQLAAYTSLAAKARRIKRDLVQYLLDCLRKEIRVVGYGAAAKGNTLLNFAGVKPDLLPCVADQNPLKQRKYLPGSRIPVISVDEMMKMRPDRVLILPWNISAEISEQLSDARTWGARFVTAVPELREF